MGIKDLNKVLTENCPNARREVRLSAFRGYGIAIDAGTLSFSNYHTAMKTVVNKTDVCTMQINLNEVRRIFLIQMRLSIESFINAGIIPIYVTDGPNAPPEKEQARSKRRKQREDLLTRIDDLETKIYSLEPRHRTAAMTGELRKLYARNTYPRQSDTDAVEFMLETMGIPVIRSTGEAEWPCVKLCREGYCVAVYSKDTDCMVHRAPIMICDKVKSRRRSKYTGVTETMVKVNVYPMILRELGWTPERFTDLAIIMGCDYNNKLKGVGREVLFELMSTYERIEDFPGNFYSNIKSRNYKIHLGSLDYETCRILFGEHSYEEIIDGYNPELGPNVDIDMNALANDGHERLMSIGVEISISELAKSLKAIKQFQDELEGVPFDITQHFEDENVVLEKTSYEISNNMMTRAGLLPSSASSSSVGSAPRVKLVMRQPSSSGSTTVSGSSTKIKLKIVTPTAPTASVAPLIHQQSTPVTYVQPSTTVPINTSSTTTTSGTTVGGLVLM